MSRHAPYVRAGAQPGPAEAKPVSPAPVQRAQAHDIAHLARVPASALYGPPPARSGAGAAAGRLARPAQAAGGPVVQRQLVPGPNGADYYVDSRDGHNAPHQFRPVGAQGGAAPQGPAASGQYTNGLRNFAYDANTRQYQTGGAYWDVAARRRLVREDHPNNPSLHRYRPAGAGGGRTHSYDPVAGYVSAQTNQARWVDSRNRFVDQPHHGDPRVLTADETGVEKQYIIGRTGQDFVLPYKPTNADFLPGLPAIHGGNIDPGETEQQTAARELREETGNRYTMANFGALLHQGRHNANGTGNRYRVNEAALAANAANHADRHEMAGEFTVRPSQFVGHTANPGAAKQRLFNLFSQGMAGNQAHTAFLAQQHGGVMPGGWAGSQSMQAFAAAMTASVGHYEAGRDGASAGAQVPAHATADHAYGHQMYGEGLADARTGGGARADEPAHATAHGHYHAGLAAAQGGQVLAANAPNAHQAGFNDYQAGLAAAHAGGGLAADAHHAHRAAFQEYQAGFDRAQAAGGRENGNAAYVAGHQAGRLPDPEPAQDDDLPAHLHDEQDEEPHNGPVVAPQAQGQGWLGQAWGWLKSWSPF